MTDIQQIKKLLPEFLERYGIEMYRDGKGWKISCLVHQEKHPSAMVNPNGTINCFGCGSIYDLFDCVGFLEGIEGFKNQLNFVCRMFGLDGSQINESQRKQKPLFRGHVKHAKHVSLDIEVARRVYAKSKVLELLNKFKIYGELNGIWPYMDLNGKVSAVDFRLDLDYEKQVITIWFDGQFIRIKEPPNLIWGLDHLDIEKPCLIVEGAKCADMSHKNIGDTFSVHTWNRGTAGAKYCDWSVLSGFNEIYIMYDADRKTDSEGALLPFGKQPGRKAADEISDRLLEQNENAIIKLMEPHEDCLKLEYGGKPDGADIEEMFKIFSVDDVVDYILNS